jgi:flagellum-specific peptidoglycan hydrolase FlgJ
MSATKDYISKHINDVMIAVEGSKIFPEVAIIQSAIESGWGKSLLARKYNNYFGIKSTRDWKGKSITLKTEEEYNGKLTFVDGTFRAYDSFQDSVKDYVKFLKENPRYTKGGVFTATSPEEQVRRLQSSGYSTTSVYADTIIKTIKYNYDFIKTKIDDYLKNNPLKSLTFIVVLGLMFYYGYKFYKLKK